MTSRPRRRLLFLLPFPPDPDGIHGGSRVVGQLLTHLTSRHEVGAIYLRGPADVPLAESLEGRLAFAEEVERPDRESTWLLRAKRAWHRAGGLSRGRPVWVTDWATPAFATRLSEIAREWRPDIVQAEFHIMGQFVGPTVASPWILVEHEPGAEATADRAAVSRGVERLLRRLDLVAWHRYTRALLARADAIVAFTDEDRTALLSLQPSARVIRIAPGVPLPAEPLDPVGQAPPRILYLGNFIHPPNVDAAVRLARTIFPLIRAHRLDAVLEIVGDGAPRELRELQGQGLVVAGRVDDVAPYLDRAAVVLAPLALGGGIRIKVMEALAAGKAVVATPRALAGLDLTPGEHAMVGTTDQELAQATVELLDDPDRRAKIARAGREWARSHLAWAGAVAAYESLYEELLADQRSRQSIAPRSVEVRQ
jgi:glycosyltransferase involved in cell wall biosynthesis